MPIIESKGAGSAQGFGEFAQSNAVNYIENVFSTYLYTGNGSTQIINNGIDLATKGGLVWVKDRTSTGTTSYDNHWLSTSDLGDTNALSSNTTGALNGAGSGGFLSNGFRTGYDTNRWGYSGTTYASWTFRKQPKFFDVVTYTGNGTNGRTVAHNLGSVPGCMLIKNTSTSGYSWLVYHTSLGNAQALFLDQTDAAFASTAWYSTTPTSTNFTLNNTGVNLNGETYVAYLFAHNAGGFGLTGTDNVISCGSATMDGSGGATVNLGYEPQWVMIKRSDGAGAWYIEDTMRGLSVGSQTSLLAANSSAAEINDVNIYNSPTSTGFKFNTGMFPASSTYIYIAIRRGPMKVPTDATKVYTANPYTATDTDGRLITSGFPVDAAIIDPRNGYSTPGGPNWFSRLTGNGYFLQTASTNAESNGSSNSNGIMGQDGITVSRTGTNVWSNVGSNTYVPWFLRRAPSFFDEVCYTGTGSATTINHNLGVVPEMIIVKNRSNAASWPIYSKSLTVNQYLILDSTAAAATFNLWNATAPTSTVFSVSTNSYVNASANTYVAYLFATCAGVSKVGSYSGTGSNQTIDCGFTGGARFVLIKRTDATSNWSVFDTARGMVSGTDPVLSLNTTSAESNLNSVYTITTGFQVLAYVNSSYPDVNISGGSYIFLAIA